MPKFHSHDNHYHDLLLFEKVCKLLSDGSIVCLKGDIETINRLQMNRIDQHDRCSIPS